MKAGIQIVLVEPKGDENIGQIARAMKNFGLEKLALVNSVEHITTRSLKWAVGTKDILEKAVRCDSLDEALRTSSCAVAFTRRTGRRRKTHMFLSDLPKWIAAGKKRNVAFVFGREDKGLSNDEIKMCDAVVHIPTSKKYPSLNLAQAVVLAGHEMFQKKPKFKKEKQEFVSRREMDGLMKRIGSLLADLSYNDTPDSALGPKILSRIERLFGRGGLTSRDIGMFEGLISRIKGRITT